MSDTPPKPTNPSDPTDSTNPLASSVGDAPPTAFNNWMAPTDHLRLQEVLISLHDSYQSLSTQLMILAETSRNLNQQVTDFRQRIGDLQDRLIQAPCPKSPTGKHSFRSGFAEAVGPCHHCELDGGTS